MNCECVRHMELCASFQYTMTYFWPPAVKKIQREFIPMTTVSQNPKMFHICTHAPKF